MVRIGGVVVALVLVTGACADDDAGERGEASVTTTTGGESDGGPTTSVGGAPSTSSTVAAGPTAAVELVDYPLFDTDVLAVDQGALDELATAYAGSVDGDPEIERFLFGHVPVVAFDDLLTI